MKFVADNGSVGLILEDLEMVVVCDNTSLTLKKKSKESAGVFLADLDARVDEKPRPQPEEDLEKFRVRDMENKFTFVNRNQPLHSFKPSILVWFCLSVPSASGSGSIFSSSGCGVSLVLPLGAWVLGAAGSTVRFLLRQGLAFRDNDETDDSVNQGNFLKFLNFLAQHNEEIDRAFKNARGNLKLRAPSIQKDIVRAAASETTKVIVNGLGDELFAVLVDEARDISIKEQMSVCLRYVNKEGKVREHFLGLVHVSNTNALSLKLALESLLETYNLSLSRVRGQGYDGASNMQGEFNGLKTLILKENSYAFYVHCFAQQLQLALVTVAKKQVEIALLFNLLTNLCNVVGASCKRRDMLRDSQMTKTIEALQSGEIASGRGLNQEIALKRAGDTRWDSHYGTILRLISLFPSVVNVLEYVEEDGNNSEQRAEACHLLNVIQSFEFIFNLHLMKNILGVTNELSQALQRNDQDIVNAMALVKVFKQRLQTIRDDGWSLLLDEVSLFCDKYNITVPKMDDIFVSQGRSRRKAQKISNLHHFQVEIFYQVVDRQLQELKNRFTEVNTELLLCIACLNSRHSFLAFDKEKLIHQLENFILDVRSDDQFSNLNGIGALSQKLVETRKHIVYPLVFLLLKLALVLPVATASVERTFFCYEHHKESASQPYGR
ncbi:zinc finger MYM-type protein 1-like [Arachis ipaensis]|uniref:zinc finger MYM-type protein 1-like n=1 Tax=Arachis ipaensis TaxID=130454 RepID=UPI0007AEEA8B|nr:zinc finger MYM-type protein 1-like [Arachis ipaensis]XP_025637184.1 zinc finger MYM-type protein 1-like [Arachis hypogaea]